jgi:hypothetical protein
LLLFVVAAPVRSGVDAVVPLSAVADEASIVASVVTTPALVNTSPLSVVVNPALLSRTVLSICPAVTDVKQKTPESKGVVVQPSGQHTLRFPAPTEYVVYPLVWHTPLRFAPGWCILSIGTQSTTDITVVILLTANDVVVGVTGVAHWSAWAKMSEAKRLDSAAIGAVGTGPPAGLVPDTPPP